MDEQALLKRIEALENRLTSVENSVEIINNFVAAIVESQSIEETMGEIESMTKQLTKCENATFYCFDSSNGKFFSHGDYRNWQEEQSANELKSAFDSKGILNDKTEVVIPLVSANGNSLGVIVAQKESGFTKSDYDNFRQGGQVVNSVELGLKKEFEHQGRITDELTHLKNRQGLNEYIENTICGNINEGRDVNILMVDIDHFKNVNDTYGHEAGDIILKDVSAVLQDFTRAGADCAFRYGGEELICVLNCSPEKAVDIAERLRETIENAVHSVTHDNEPIDIKVTVSMGLHNMNPEAEMLPENAKEIFKAELAEADKALYQAKETGRNKLVTTNEKMYVSYLALKAAEILCCEDRTNIDEVKAQTLELLTIDKDFDTVIEALQAHADEYPEFSDAVAAIISKINEKRPIEEEKEMNTRNYNTNEKKEPTYYNREGFKGIQNKEYIRTDAKTAYAISQKAQQYGVEHSVKYDGSKSAVTVDGVQNKMFVDSVKREFNIPETTQQTNYKAKTPKRSEHNEKLQEKAPKHFGRSEVPKQRNEDPAQKKDASFFNREGFKDIKNKTYIQTDSKTAYSISKQAQAMGVEHSARYSGEKSAVTVDGVKNRDFIEAVTRMAEWANKVQVREAQNHSRNTAR